MQNLKMLTAAVAVATFGTAGIANAQETTGDSNQTMKRSEAVRPADPEHARDTHTSAYKKTYPDEAPIMGSELSPDQKGELTPSEKHWEENFKKWDADQSGALADDEFNSGFDIERVYSGWDTNRDGNLSKDEFRQGLFSRYDRDGDDEWSKQEYNRFADDTGEDGWLDM